VRVQELDGAGLLATPATPDPVLPTTDSVKKLPYLDAVIHESLRCFPPVPPGGARQLSADLTVLSVTLPKGTVLSLPIWPLHYSEGAWGPDAGEWRPWRWLEARSMHAAKRDARGDLRWALFAQGSQNCLGQHVALVRRFASGMSRMPTWRQRELAAQDPAGHGSCVPECPNVRHYITLNHPVLPTYTLSSAFSTRPSIQSSLCVQLEMHVTLATLVGRLSVALDADRMLAATPAELTEGVRSFLSIQQHGGVHLLMAPRVEGA
jgi:Cytochrome P450